MLVVKGQKERNGFIVSKALQQLYFVLLCQVNDISIIVFSEVSISRAKRYFC